MLNFQKNSAGIKNMPALFFCGIADTLISVTVRWQNCHEVQNISIVEEMVPVIRREDYTSSLFFSTAPKGSLARRKLPRQTTVSPTEILL